MAKALQSADAAVISQTERKAKAKAAWDKKANAYLRHNGLLSRVSHIDEPYYQELQLSIGYNKNPKGESTLEWVALGGHEITMFLPPEVLEEIMQRVQEL